MESLQPQGFGVLIGASVTFIASIIVLIFTNRGHDKRQKLQHYHENAISKARFYREKIEDTYLSFSKWERNFVAMYVGLLVYVKGEVSEKDAFDLIKMNQTNQIEFGNNRDKVEMLITLYFPCLIPQFENVMIEREKVAQYFPQRNESLIGDYAGYCAAQISFEEKSKEFKEALKSELNKF